MASQSPSPLTPLDQCGIQVINELAALSIQAGPFVPTGPNDSRRSAAPADGASTPLPRLSTPVAGPSTTAEGLVPFWKLQPKLMNQKLALSNLLTLEPVSGGPQQQHQQQHESEYKFDPTIPFWKRQQKITNQQLALQNIMMREPSPKIPHQYQDEEDSNCESEFGSVIAEAAGPSYHDIAPGDHEAETLPDFSCAADYHRALLVERNPELEESTARERALKWHQWSYEHRDVEQIRKDPRLVEARERAGGVRARVRPLIRPTPGAPLPLWIPAGRQGAWVGNHGYWG
ncbi:Protein of unknown function [Pyronema omphalodes CBS 100304]|uniref:Uncharacterized protein n=1 Tax=Pyronema omphalodes (strain CBS 100304) TaxID=1076935 RepID=U4L3U9_PYROM|nr:Protein of unknown function [Pyronema omphalodes CBS 100304]